MKMKTQMFRLLLTGAVLAASVLGAEAQTRDRKHEVSAFSVLDVKNAFEVTVAQGAYGVKLTVDTALSDYVNVYVKGRTLYIGYEEKSVPKEIRKMYRGRNAPKPILRAVVYTPTLEGVYLDDEASLTAADVFEGANFEMSLSGKTNVKSLTVHAASAKVHLRKNAEAVLTVDSEGSVDVDTDNSSRLRLSTRSRELNLTTSGSSQIDLSGDLVSALVVNSEGSSQINAGINAAKVYVSATGSSKLALSGSASGLVVKGARSCNIDAMGLPVPEAEVEMNSGTLLVSPGQRITVDLSGGSAVYYNGEPEVNIVKILKSTYAPYGTK